MLFCVYFIFSISSFSSAQEAPKIPQIKNKRVGPWVNIHEKRNDLLGVKVQQFPDNPHAASEYEGKHPSMIIYVFNSMEAHQIEYNPNGTVKSGFWWQLGKGHPILKQISKSR